MKRPVIVLFLVLAATFGIVVFSIYLTGKISEEQIKVAPAVVESKGAEKPMRQLIPSRPQDYGMVVMEETDKPKTQEDWNSLLSHKISQLKSEYPPEVWAQINSKINEEPEKTEEKLKLIDEKIQYCIDILAKEPDNQDIKSRLERLMILKALAKELSPSWAL